MCTTRTPSFHLFFVCLYANLLRVLPKMSIFSAYTSHSMVSMLFGPVLVIVGRTTGRRNGRGVLGSGEGDLTHALNSPSFLPTISSVMSTSLYIFPLCTWKRNPTKLGRIVALRAWVLMGVGRWPGTVGVMRRLVERGDVSRCLLEVGLELLRIRTSGRCLYGTMCGPGCYC